jgi:hypothetical protein
MGLYHASQSESGESVNLLHVRRLRQVGKPFSVSQLVNVKDGGPVSDKRTTAGSWVYVQIDNLPALLG